MSSGRRWWRSSSSRLGKPQRAASLALARDEPRFGTFRRLVRRWRCAAVRPARRAAVRLVSSTLPLHARSKGGLARCGDGVVSEQAPDRSSPATPWPPTCTA